MKRDPGTQNGLRSINMNSVSKLAILKEIFLAHFSKSGKGRGRGPVFSFLSATREGLFFGVAPQKLV